jgi:hypothetical protein
MAHSGKTFRTATHKPTPHPLAPRSRLTGEQFAPETYEQVTAAPGGGGRVALTVQGPAGLGHTTLDVASARELAALISTLADEADAAAPAAL